MIDPVFEAVMKLTNGKPVKAMIDACSQGGPDAVIVLDSGKGDTLCSSLYQHEAQNLAIVIKGVLAQRAAVSDQL